MQLNAPGDSIYMAAQVVDFKLSMGHQELDKSPGVAETVTPIPR